MLVKVCGLKDQENLNSIAEQNPDFIGMIFYYPSKRNVTSTLSYNGTIKKVGVFVNSSIQIIESKIQEFGLDYIQLHGNETPKFCEELYLKGYQIIKAFSVNADFNFEDLKPYIGFCKYFLFDTKAELPGGNGIKFNWEILNHYKEQVPFLLSGGIQNRDIENILNLNFPYLIGIDINSKYEIEPGIKNIELVNKTINKIKNAVIK